VLNLADTAKLVALSGFAAASWPAARRSAAAPGWFTVRTGALVILLPLGGAAFLVSNPVLSALLIASLPVLLIWVAAVTAVAARRLRPVTDTVPEPSPHDLRGRVTGW
jgi:heme A synthase